MCRLIIFAPTNVAMVELISNYLIEGRDYFVGTAKPNYSPYQYPHPLHQSHSLVRVQHYPSTNPPPKFAIRIAEPKGRELKN